MKVKLLKRLRRISRQMVTIYSITRTNGYVSGMKYGISHPEYRGVFDFGDTEEDVYRKVFRIYITTNIDELKRKFKKH